MNLLKMENELFPHLNDYGIVAASGSSADHHALQAMIHHYTQLYKVKCRKEQEATNMVRKYTYTC